MEKEGVEGSESRFRGFSLTFYHPQLGSDKSFEQAMHIQLVSDRNEESI